MNQDDAIFRPGLLKDKHILITGGGTGLGRAMSERFLRLGAAVHICGRRQEVLEQAVADLTHLGPVRGWVCDVREAESVERMVRDIWAQAALDVVVNNAAGNFLARTEELSPRAWQAVTGIVLSGTINVTMAVARRWLEAKGGVFLNISTTYASTGSAYVVPSAVSKAGVDALTRSLAVEWGPRGIRCNGIAPGAIRTEGAFSRLLPLPDLERKAMGHNPLHRFGTLDEFTSLAAFLVSDASAYINGEVVVMDGGAQLQGAGGFSELGRSLSDEDWARLKPKKKNS